MGRPRGGYGPDKREARNRLLPPAAGRPPLSQSAGGLPPPPDHQAPDPQTPPPRRDRQSPARQLCRWAGKLPKPNRSQKRFTFGGQPYALIASIRRPLRQDGKAQTALSPAKTAVPVAAGRERTHRK